MDIGGLALNGLRLATQAVGRPASWLVCSGSVSMAMFLLRLNQGERQPSALSLSSGRVSLYCGKKLTLLLVREKNHEPSLSSSALATGALLSLVWGSALLLIGSGAGRLPVNRELFSWVGAQTLLTFGDGVVLSYGVVSEMVTRRNAGKGQWNGEIEKGDLYLEPLGLVVNFRRGVAALSALYFIARVADGLRRLGMHSNTLPFSQAAGDFGKLITYFGGR